jgi:hypothetical protein
MTRRSLHRAWLIAYGHVEDIRGAVIAAVLNRIATPGMRHAALLLGADYGAGYGKHFFLEHLHEFTIGAEFGCYHSATAEALSGISERERAEVASVFELERSLYL